MKEIRNEKIMWATGTALATVAAAVGLYNVFKAEPEIAGNKAPTVPTQEQMVEPAIKGSMAQSR